jgi:aminoglycoside phosphotransferase (APT) family kinase protein
VSVTVVEDGFDFRVLILDDTWVVRVPRRPVCAEALAMEAALLPALSPALPVPVPQFEFVEGFAVYRMLEGTPLVDEEDGVRGFLDALHAFEVGDLPVPRPDWVETYARQCDKFRRVVLPLLGDDERARAEALFAEVETLAGFEPAFTHSDLGPEHLLCRDGRLVGVIDWGDARVGDPALDYAWLLNEPFPHWDVDDELRRRARFYYRLAPFFGVHYSEFMKRDPRESLASLRSRLRPV